MSIENLGRCCCCGRRRGVRNIVMIPRRAPVPGTGWACLVCDLPADGASYVCCDLCLETGARPTEVVRGFVSSGEREPIENLSTEVFDHDRAMHHPGEV
jgi:hypothetical protein